MSYCAQYEARFRRFTAERLYLKAALINARHQKRNQPWSEYKHSLTFRVRRYTHLQCVRLVWFSFSWCFSLPVMVNKVVSLIYELTYVCVVMSTKPVHRLQIFLIMHNYRASPTFAASYIRVRARAVVWECGEGQTDRHRQPWPIYISPRLCLIREM